MQKVIDEKSYTVHRTRRMYENTVLGDLTRRLWIDWFLNAEILRLMDETNRNYYNEDFLFDFAKALIKFRAKVAIKADTCVYHIHGPDFCYKNWRFP